MTKNKTVIITNKILSYRNDFYEKLGAEINLTVVHFGEIKKNSKYEIINADVNRYCSFFWIKDLSKIIDEGNYDSIICMYDLRFLTIYRLAFSKLRKQTIFWGIGISSSSGLKDKKFIDIFRVFIGERVKALLLYSSKVELFYRKYNFRRPIYVATNSVKISNNASSTLNSLNLFQFLFVGSLDKRKGIDIFLRAISSLIKDHEQGTIIVNIIGEGSEKLYLKDLTKKLNINKSVIFQGNITDPDTLTGFYKNSILSFSINQAGLSVLQSLGNGVPFLTSIDAITGGELHNIIDLKNGYLIPSDVNKEAFIENLLIKIIQNPNKTIEMREFCRINFLENSSLENMVDVFKTAINYSI
jgi:glycosyltransferase involved in cell wall biosynthesis